METESSNLYLSESQQLLVIGAAIAVARAQIAHSPILIAWVRVVAFLGHPLAAHEGELP